MSDFASRSSSARLVRPYTLTSGRTRGSVDLPMEATLERLPHRPLDLSDAAAKVLAVCDGKSVAEVSAKLEMPLGVVRVLLGDLVIDGCISVQRTITEDSSRDERIELMERTLRGLRNFS